MAVAIRVCISSFGYISDPNRWSFIGDRLVHSLLALAPFRSPFFSHFGSLSWSIPILSYYPRFLQRFLVNLLIHSSKRNPDPYYSNFTTSAPDEPKESIIALDRTRSHPVPPQHPMYSP
jgi:hypothetical protein